MPITAELPLRAIPLASAAALHDLLKRHLPAHYGWGSGKTKSVEALEEELLIRQESRLCWVADPKAEYAFGPLLVRDIYQTVTLRVVREVESGRELLHEFIIRDNRLFSTLKRLDENLVTTAVQKAVVAGRLSPRGYGSGLSEKARLGEAVEATFKRMCREELGIRVRNEDFAPNRFRLLQDEVPNLRKDTSKDRSEVSILESFLSLYGIRPSNSFPGLWTRNANLVRAEWSMPPHLQKDVYLAEHRYVSFWKEDDGTE